MIVGKQRGEGDVLAKAGVANEGYPLTLPDLSTVRTFHSLITEEH